MKKELMDGNEAAAWGARLSKVKVIPNFPITPQTEIIEKLAEWKAKKEWNGEFVSMESEHSVLSAAIASEATGVRTFTASSSQGLMLMHEMHYVASGMRQPLVMVNCSRGLAAPITLWPDQNDIFALRDSGWIMLFAKNNQEVLDSIIQSYKIAEDRNVLLPVIVNMEGFILSFTSEPTIIPDQSKVDKFLPKYVPKTFLDPKKPMSLGVPAMEGYMYYRSQVHKAQLNSIKTIRKVGKEFKKSFGRSYDLIEKYKTNDAKIIFVSVGSLSTTIQAAVDSLRKKGIRAGLLRIRCLRPFPKGDVIKVLRNKKIAVIDNNISPGMGGILYSELSGVLDNKNISSFIVSLGGKHIGRKDFELIARKAIKGKRFWVL
jgi:pyruvate ferredoxin oxidoreductase alpha subunit